MDDLTFAAAIRQRPLDVPLAALCFAREIAYPELDLDGYLRRLAGLAEQARDRIPATDPPLVQAELLAEWLFGSDGFRGNEAGYDEPDNSYLNQVLERRLGIPISLSVLFVAVARRLDLSAYGVGLPGHFIAGLRDGQRVVYFDPFHGGGRLSMADNARLVAETTGYRGPLRPEWLAPADPVDILTRMLNNLRLTYIQRERWPRARAVIERLRLLHPDEPTFTRDLGLVTFRAGDLLEGLRWLEIYLDEAPQASDAASLRRGLKPAIDSWVRLN